MAYKRRQMVKTPQHGNFFNISVNLKIEFACHLSYIFICCLNLKSPENISDSVSFSVMELITYICIMVKCIYLLQTIYKVILFLSVYTAVCVEGYDKDVFFRHCHTYFISASRFSL